MSIKLSICIPTYNRCEYLREALESIVGQMTDEVEVAISDNASTDGTENMVAEFQKKYQNIVYSRVDENQGADRNYLRAVELARGEYCWLLGSDDTMKESAIKDMLNEVKSCWEVYIVNRTECSLTMVPKRERGWLHDDIGDSVYDFSDRNDVLNYFEKAQSIGAVFSYLSSLIFRRSLWNSVLFDERFIGTAYSHVHQLLGGIKNGGKLKYIKKSFVNFRSDNDSFGVEGQFKRIVLDLRGYKMFADKFFADDIEMSKAFLRIMHREHRLSYLKLFKWYGDLSLSEYEGISRMLSNEYGFPEHKLKTITYINHNFSKLISRMYRRYFQ